MNDIGRPRKYPIHMITPKSYIRIPVDNNDRVRSEHKIRLAVQYETKKGKMFRTETCKLTGDLIVWRYK